MTGTPLTSVTVADSISFLSPKKTNIIRYFKIFFLYYHETVCCVYSLETHDRGDSNEYTQNTIIL